MNVQIGNQTVERSSPDFKEYSFGIKDSGIPFILNILRNSLYSDKVLAVARELAQNAHDAGVECKTKRPFEIKVPTLLDPTFVVRDFAKGMSEDEISNIFVNYGESTKREGKLADKLLGGFGVGAKSVFCLSDSFQLCSIQNKKKTIYTAYIDETGYGKLARLNVAKTNEPDGMEFIVPVKPADCEAFKNKSFEVVKYFPLKPIFKGVEEQPTFEENKTELIGDGWAFNGKGTSVAIVGCLGYKIDQDAVRDYLEDTEYGLVCSGFNFFFGVSEVNVSANRESLEFNDKTIAAIKAKLQKIIIELPAIVNAKISACNNILEAKQFYRRYFLDYREVAGVLDTLKDKLLWRGENVSNWEIDLHTVVATGLTMTAYFKKRGRRYNSGEKVRSCPTNSITVNENLVLMVCDLDKKVQARMETFFDEPANTDVQRVYLLRFANDAAKEAFFKRTAIDLSTLPLISQFNPRPKIVNGVIQRSYNPKHMAKVLKLDFDQLDKYVSNSGYRYTRRNRCAASELWIHEQIDKDKGGVYVRIEKLKPVMGERQLLTLSQQMKSIGFTVDVYGAKPSAKLGDGKWIEFSQWVKNTLEAYLNMQIGLKQAVLTVKEYGEHEVDDLLLKLSEWGVTDSEITNYTDAVKACRGNTSEAGTIHEILNSINAMSLADGKDNQHGLGKAKDACYAKFPLLNFLDSYQLRSKGKDAVLHYIGLVNNS
jgi:hypothetical protein